MEVIQKYRGYIKLINWEKKILDREISLWDEDVRFWGFRGAWDHLLWSVSSSSHDVFDSY